MVRPLDLFIQDPDAMRYELMRSAQPMARGGVVNMQTGGLSDRELVDKMEQQERSALTSPYSKALGKDVPYELVKYMRNQNVSASDIDASSKVSGNKPYTVYGVPSLIGEYVMPGLPDEVLGQTFFSTPNETNNKPAVVIGIAPKPWFGDHTLTRAHEMEHALDRTGAAAYESGTTVNELWDKLNAQNNKQPTSREDIVRRLIEHAPYLKKNWGLTSDDVNEGYFSGNVLNPSYVSPENVKTYMREQFATLSALEQMKNKRLTDDPYIQQNVFKTPADRETYNALTGLRQARLDARDLPPYTRQPEPVQPTPVPKQGMVDWIRNKVGFGEGGRVYGGAVRMQEGGSFNPEGSDYDYQTARAHGIGQDGGNWGSVAPTSDDERTLHDLPEDSYVMLKGAQHPTWHKAVEAEQVRGSKIVKHGDRYYSVPHMQEGGDATQADLDRMRLELANSPVIEPRTQSGAQRSLGTLGGYMDAAGRFIRESLEPVSAANPVKTGLVNLLVADPLSSAGTALQDWTGTSREITEEQPYTRAPITGGGTLQTFRVDPRVLDVAQFASPLVGRAAGAARTVASDIQRAARAEGPLFDIAAEFAGAPAHVVKPEGNLNFQPRITAEMIKGPEMQTVEAMANQLKGKQGITAEGIKIATEHLDPKRVMSKHDFPDSLAPSKYNKVDIIGKHSGDTEHFINEALDNISLSDVFHSEGIPSKYHAALSDYFYNGSSDMPSELQSYLKQRGWNNYRDFSDTIDTTRHDLARGIADAMVEESPLSYADRQRLAGPDDSSNTGGYFEIGLQHPQHRGYYQHYNTAPQGIVGHVRGTFLNDFMDSYTSAKDDIKGLPNPKPNSMLIEEIQSDSNKSSNQVGPLHQVHGMLFKTAIQHALENGATTVYLPTANTISSVRNKPASSFAPVYDLQVVKGGLNPLKQIPGVTTEKIINPATGEHSYTQIDFTPEAKDYILSGSGQTIPGYAHGGAVHFASDIDAMRHELTQRQ